MSLADRLCYRYQLTFTVIAEADGLHADGYGATATRKRIEKALAADPRIIEVRPSSHPRYIGGNPPPSMREIDDEAVD